MSDNLTQYLVRTKRKSHVERTTDLSERLSKVAFTLSNQIDAFDMNIDRALRNDFNKRQIEMLESQIISLAEEIKLFSERTILNVNQRYEGINEIEKKMSIFNERIEDYAEKSTTLWNQISDSSSDELAIDEKFSLLSEDLGDVNTKIGMQVATYSSLVESKKNMELSQVTNFEDHVRKHSELILRYLTLIRERENLTHASLKMREDLLKSKCELGECLEKLIKSYKEVRS